MDGEWFFLVIILLCFLSNSDSNATTTTREYEPPPFDWDEWNRNFQLEMVQQEIDRQLRESEDRISHYDDEDRY